MNNEPAFPLMVEDYSDDDGQERVLRYQTGLTKRELIAAMMAQGMLAYGFHGNPVIHVESVRHADALLAELSKEESK